MALPPGIRLPWRSFRNELQEEKMKVIGKNTLRMAAPALVAVGLLLALPLAAQKDFNQSEKEMLAKYKQARTHFLKGGEYLKKGKLDKAQKEAATSLAILPQYADARLLGAELGYQRGQYEEALKEIETAKSDFVTVKDLYAFSYQEHLARLRDQRDEMEKYVQDMSAGASDKSSSAGRNPAQAAISKARQDIAEIDRKLHEPIPQTLEVPAEFHYIHGNILFKLKRFGEARDQYQAAVKADPRHGNAWNNLVSIHFAGGDPAGALKLLEEAEANGVTVNEKLKKAVLEKK
jgi:tetratricopeptide (TPR) repeat protein